VLLAATALQEITRTVQAENALRAGLRDLRAETQWQAHREAVYGLDLTADNSLLATRSNDNSAKLWAVDENFAPLSDRALMTMTHGGDVTGLVLSADGQRVATSSRDDTVRIWDVATRAQVISHTLDADVRALRVAPDGNTLVSRSGSRLQLWDFTTGAEIPTDRPLESVGAALRDVAFSRDGRMLVAGSDDVTLWMWEVPSGRRVRVGGFAGAVDGVGFSPSGQFLFAKSRDNLRLFQVPLITRDGQNLVDTDRIFDSDSAANIAARIGTVTRDIVTQDIDAVMEPVQLPGMDDGSFNAVTFSGDEKLLIVGGSDGSIRIWDLLHPDREPRWLRGHTQQINALHTSPDDRLLLSTSLDDTVRIWQLETGEALAVLSTAPENALIARFTPDGLHLYTTDNSGHVQLWRVDAGDAVGYANVNANPPGPLLVLPGLSGDTILTGGEDGLLESWQPQDGRVGAAAPSDVRLEALAATADGARVAVGAQDGSISLVAWPEGTVTARWPAHANGVRSLLFLDDGALLASSGGDATIRLWDGVTGAPVGQLTGHTNDVNALALAPDGEILISGSADRTVRRWRWRTGQEMETIQAGMSVLTVAVDPAGTTIAAGGFSQRVRVWALNNVSSSMVRSLPHSAFVRALAFDPAGRLISGDERGLVRLWDLTTGEATIMQAHDAGWVRSIGVAADGHLFYSVGDDGIVRAWPLTNEVLLAHACSRLSRGLSPVELDDFAPFLTSGEPCRAVAAPPPVVVSRSQAAPLPFPADTIAGLPRILYFEALAGSVVEAGQEFDLRWALDGATH
ncbi:MAG: WD40 repeat domain-containing protein, partial [Caldilineaceae bacterium]|nr:WD40 repeat domain-containing protein [Caldilineaceae bacterium]